MSPELLTGLIVLGAGSLVGWGIWVTTSIMDHKGKIEDTDEIKKDFEAFEIKFNFSLDKSEKKQKEMEDRITTSIDNFNKILHLWKDTMIDELKSIVKNERSNRGRQRTSE